MTKRLMSWGIGLTMLTFTATGCGTLGGAAVGAGAHPRDAGEPAGLVHQPAADVGRAHPGGDLRGVRWGREQVRRSVPAQATEPVRARSSVPEWARPRGPSMTSTKSEGLTMRTWLQVTSGLAMGLVLWSGAALAQVKPGCDAQGKVKAADKIEGQVVKIDAAQGKVTVRESGGTTHEFQASAETLKDLKVGDQIGAKLREARSARDASGLDFAGTALLTACAS